MSIDYILQKVQDPKVSSADLTLHFLYYFNQLSGRSGFSIDDTYLPTAPKIITTIVQHPSWDYGRSVAQVTASFCKSSSRNPLSKAQQQKHTVAFEIFLEAMTERL